MPIADHLHDLLGRGGPLNPVRHVPASAAPAVGTLHAVPMQRRGAFPFTLALLVRRVERDEVVICPAIVPPAVDREFLPDDRWLPANRSPFRSLPGTGLMQVRWGWVATVPPAALGPALRVIDLDELLADVPKGLRPRVGLPAWDDAWRGMTRSLI